jgi:hypothetical protein
MSALQGYSQRCRNTYKDCDGKEIELYTYWEDFGGNKDFLYNTEPLVMGFELELEVNPRWDMEDDDESDLEKLALDIVTSSGSDVICKRDSSLVHGFEVVSHPATLEYYENKFEWRFLSDIHFAHLRTYMDFSKPFGECGFHIHMNRASFQSEQHTIRFAQAIVDDVLSDENVMLLCNNYCKAQVSSGRYAERYCSVNLQHTNTVEVRCFVPTTNRNEVIGYMKYLLNKQTETGETK